MAKNEEKKRRKAMVAEIAKGGQARAEVEMPIAKADLKKLFDFVDEQLEANGCDHTLKATRAFLAQRDLPQEAIVPWLVEEGGGCDCEVIANVEETWGEAVGSV